MSSELTSNLSHSNKLITREHQWIFNWKRKRTILTVHILYESKCSYSKASKLVVEESCFRWPKIVSLLTTLTTLCYWAIEFCAGIWTSKHGAHGRSSLETLSQGRLFVGKIRLDIRWVQLASVRFGWQLEQMIVAHQRIPTPTPLVKCIPDDSTIKDDDDDGDVVSFRSGRNKHTASCQPQTVDHTRSNQTINQSNYISEKEWGTKYLAVPDDIITIHTCLKKTDRKFYKMQECDLSGGMIAAVL